MKRLSRSEKLVLIGAILCFIGALINYVNIVYIDSINIIFVIVIAVIEVIAIRLGISEHYKRLWKKKL